MRTCGDDARSLPVSKLVADSVLLRVLHILLRDMSHGQSVECRQGPPEVSKPHGCNVMQPEDALDAGHGGSR